MTSPREPAPIPPPKYIYKIVPSAAAPPDPLPPKLPLSALDANDGFIHLSTSFQILRTLRLFFSSEADAKVYILRIELEKVGHWVRWEDVNGKGPVGQWDVQEEKGYFPHVYGNGEDGGLRLGSEEVESVGVWVRDGGEWSAKGWPFEQDVPA